MTILTQHWATWISLLFVLSRRLLEILLNFLGVSPVVTISTYFLPVIRALDFITQRGRQFRWLGCWIERC